VYNSIGTLAAEYGVGLASEVAGFEVDNLEALKSFIEKEEISCDLEVDSVFDAQFDNAYSAKLSGRLESLVANGSKGSDQVDFVPGGAAAAVRHCLLCHGYTTTLGSLRLPYKGSRY
jgi:hypothetical protein